MLPCSITARASDPGVDAVHTVQAARAAVQQAEQAVQAVTHAPLVDIQTLINDAVNSAMITANFSNCILVNTNFDKVTFYYNKFNNITYDYETKESLRKKDIYLVKYEETEGIQRGHGIGNQVDMTDLNLEGCFDYVPNSTNINLYLCKFHKHLEDIDIIDRLLFLTREIENLRTLPINKEELFEIIQLDKSKIIEKIKKFEDELSNEKESSQLFEASIKRKKLKKMKQKERSKRFEIWAKKNDWEIKKKSNDNIVFSKIEIDDSGFEKEILEFKSNLIREMIKEEKLGTSKIYTISEIRDLLNGCELYFLNKDNVSLPVDYKLYRCNNIHFDDTDASKDNNRYALVGPATICRNCIFTGSDKIRIIFNNNMNFCQFIDCQFTNCTFSGSLNCASFEGCTFKNTQITTLNTRHIRIIFAIKDSPVFEVILRKYG